jgi:hypothetical protein
MLPTGHTRDVTDRSHPRQVGGLRSTAERSLINHPRSFTIDIRRTGAMFDEV